MGDATRYDEKDPLHHTARLRDMLIGLVDHAREDVTKVQEPKAQALFETTAEVCAALATAMQHYEQQSEQAWKR
jgi:hypothetical protein